MSPLFQCTHSNFQMLVVIEVKVALVSQFSFYVYQLKHDLLKIHNGREKILPSKRVTRDSNWYCKLTVP
jgi:hypothetical protein